MPLRPPTTGLRRAGIGLLVAAALACSAGRAGAECGDYVTIGHPHAAPAVPAADGPLPVRPPCHGPGCSARPMPTDAPPVTAPSYRFAATDDAAQPVVGAAVDGGRPGRPDRAGPQGEPVHRPTDQFRPPRPF